jgi:hypothetical protein
MSLDLEALGRVRKTVAAFLGLALSNVLLVLPQDGGFGDLTTYQWVLVISSTLGVPAVVYGVPNDKPAATGRHAVPE